MTSLRVIDLSPGQSSPKEVVKECLDSYNFMLEMFCGLENPSTSIETLQGNNAHSEKSKATAGKKACAHGQFQDYK